MSDYDKPTHVIINRAAHEKARRILTDLIIELNDLRDRDDDDGPEGRAYRERMDALSSRVATAYVWLDTSGTLTLAPHER